MDKKKIIILVACLFIIIGLGTFVFAGSSDPEYTVTFNSNGGTNVESQKITSGETASKPQNPTRENYEFAGWYLSLEDENEYDFQNKVLKNVTLIAKWTTKGEDNNQTNNNEENPKEEEKKDQEQTNTTTTNTKKPSNNSSTKPSTPSKPIEEPPVVKPTEDPDQTKLTSALNSMTAKNITTNGVSLNYEFAGCTITNTSNKANNAKTTVENSTVKTLYRGVNNGSITSNYTVTCGSKSSTKTVNHVISASTYKYTSTYNDMDYYTIKINGATDYTLNIYGETAKYLPIAKGAQIGGTKHVVGSTYDMKFNNNANVTYAVKSAE